MWVSKSAAEKRLRCAWIRDVALGRSGSDLFRKSTGKDRDHAPELCLSVLYDEHESDLAKGKPARTLDLVCESPAKAATWARGLLLARDRARNPPPKPPPLSAKTAFLVSKAVNKFRKNKKPFPEEYDTGPIAEPGDVHVWGFLHASMASSEELARAKAAADERERRDAKDDARRTASERASLNPLLHIQPPRVPSFVARLTPALVPGLDGVDVASVALGDRSAVGVSSAGGGGRGGGYVYAWGDASGGRLGTADLSSIARREPARVGGLGGGFRAVACGRGVALAVGADGGLVAWGDARGGGGAMIPDECKTPGGFAGSRVAWTPTRVRVPPSGATRDETRADENDVLPGATTTSSRAFRSGRNRDAPAAAAPSFVAVACGGYHAAALDASGGLFAWGEGAFGALGFGSRASLAEPRRVPGPLVGLRVASVSCGAYHTAAVVRGAGGRGELWTWGDAEGGKLGYEPPAGEASRGGRHWLAALAPTRVDPPGGFASGGASSSSDVWDVAKVSCGRWHTLALEASGAAWSCGAVGRVVVVGGDGGGSSEASSSSHIVGPRRVTLPSGEALVAADAASGDEHAAAIAVSATGAREVYTWGRGADGALGHGGVADEPAPRLVAALRGREGRCVACGPRTTAAVVAPRALTTKEKAELAKAPVTFAAAAPAEKKKISRPASRPESSSRAASRAPSQAPSRVASSLDLRNLSEAPLEGRGGTHSRDANKNPNPSPPLGAAEARWRDSAASASSARVVSDATLRRARAEALAATRGERRAPGRSRRAERREGEEDPKRRERRKERRRRAARVGRASRRGGAAERGAAAKRGGGARGGDGAGLARRGGGGGGRGDGGGVDADDSNDARGFEFGRRLGGRAGVLVLVVSGGGGGGGGGARGEGSRRRGGGGGAPRARAEALEERVVLAEFELAGARAERREREEAEEAGERRSPARAPAEGAAAAGTTTTTTTKTTMTKTPPPPPPPPPLAPLAADTRGHLHVSVGAASSASSASSESSAALGGGGESPADVEWVEEPEEGVFLTVAADRASGAHVLRRVRFSRKKFAAEEANEWWGKNRARVMKTRGLKVQRS